LYRKFIFGGVINPHLIRFPFIINPKLK